MAWKKGQSGNPTGRSNEKMFADMVRLVVSEEDPVTKRRKLRRIVEKLAECAMAGEGWAIQQVADRLDGKPAQESTVTVRSELDGMNEPELREFIRRELEAGGGSDAAAAECSYPGQLN